MSHAFNDWNVMPEHSVRIYRAIADRGVPAQAFFHQGGHGGPPPLAMMNRWFSHFLYGVENGVVEGPRAWIVREGAKDSDPTPYPDYPNPDASPVALYPGGEGGTAGRLDPDLVLPSGEQWQTLVDDASITGAEHARATSSRHRLLYETAELTRPVHVSGTARVSLRLSCDRTATNLSVWIVSLPWTETRDINSNIITRGWADPQNRNSLVESEPLVPGEFVDVSFELQPDDQIIPAGQRIGLMIFASDRDFTLWPEPGTELSVDLAGTSLTLPVVGGAEAIQGSL